MIARVAAAALLILAFAGAAWAHQLTVFASVDGAEVVVEAKFSNGKRPVQGAVRVISGDETLLMTLPLEADGFARFPLDSVDHAGGLLIEVQTSGSHEGYWILTPADIANGLSQ